MLNLSTTISHMLYMLQHTRKSADPLKGGLVYEETCIGTTRPLDL